MWTVIYMVPNEQKAMEMKEKLVNEGFLVRIQPISKINEHSFYEILVPGEEAQEAHSILVELGLS